MHWLQGFAQNLSWLQAGLWEKIWKRFVAEGNTYHIVPTSHLNIYIYVNNNIIFVKSECCNIKHSKAWILHTGILLHAWVITCSDGYCSVLLADVQIFRIKKHGPPSHCLRKAEATPWKSSYASSNNYGSSSSSSSESESRKSYLKIRNQTHCSQGSHCCRLAHCFEHFRRH